MKKLLIFTFLTLLMPNIVNTKGLNGDACCSDSECESNYCSGQTNLGRILGCMKWGYCKNKP